MVKDFSEKKMIVVTGGAGFIGSGVIRHLNNSGVYNIIVVDELDQSEKWKNLVGKQFVDILDKSHLFHWLESKDPLIHAFIHLGACSNTVEADSNYLLENNYRYTSKLAQYALRHRLRFIYASSAATYGDGALGFEDDHASINRYHPLNMYGYSKHLFDQWALQEGVLDKVVGLKYFNVFGPNENHKGRMASAITHILPSAQREGFIKLFKSSDPHNFADGGQKRDFIYVKDAARMTCAFLHNQAGGIFNIGTGNANTWNDVAKAVFAAIEKPIDIRYIDMPADLLGKYQNYTCAAMKKTVEAIGNAASCQPLEDSVADYIRNYLIPGKTW